MNWRVYHLNEIRVFFFLSGAFFVAVTIICDYGELGISDLIVDRKYCTYAAGD